MDVQKGHCWRCEKVLPQTAVFKCNQCPLAEYCSESCQQKDRVRHGSVECQVFGPKRCNQCGKQGNTKECSSCNNAWYCNSACQRLHWARHKAECKRVLYCVFELGHSLGERHRAIGGNVHKMGDPPAYIGNTIAVDFLQLTNNEWSELATVGEEELKRDYYVLSAGCGDLRSTLLTIASLPDTYEGTVHFTLDDYDPFVMARNAFFLAMMVKHAARNGIASSLATIWYSVHISHSDYNLVREMLQELIQMDYDSLSELTHGLVSIQEADMSYMREVWEGWLQLQCKRGAVNCTNHRQRRQKIFDECIGALLGLPQYLNRMPPGDAKFMRKWFSHGLFLPENKDQGSLPFDNPTLTGRPSRIYEPERTRLNPGMNSPKDYKFEYNVNTDATPFRIWDCLRVAEFTGQSHLSVMERFHAYVTHIIQQSICVISQKRIKISIFLANCLDFPNHHLTLQLPKYDRIFTSNLQDTLGLGILLKAFKPLLNGDNQHAVIATQTLNWFMSIPESDVQNVSQLEARLYQDMCRQDTGFSRKLCEDVNNHREYLNNTHWFLVYLRADINGGGIGLPAIEGLPTFTEVIHFNGMQMRDFRKGVNKLVPFQYRVNARKITLQNGMDRNLEWCLPNQNG